MAAFGARAAARADAADPRGDGDGRQRPGSATSCCRVRKRPAGAGLAGWTQPADRVPLGERRRSLAPQRGRAGGHAPRPDLGDQYAGDGRAAGAGRKRADRVRAGDRPGRPGPSVQPRASSGHITGFTNFEFSIGTKWLEALKQIAPRVTRVALIFNLETAPYAGLFQRPVEAAAPAFAVTPVAVAVRTAAELERAVGAFAGGPTGGAVLLPGVSKLIPRGQYNRRGAPPPPPRG